MTFWQVVKMALIGATTVFVAATFIAPAVATPAAAAEFTRRPQANSPYVITISGFIEQGDDKKFAELTWGLNDAIVVLNSRGGYNSAATNIGLRIRSHNYETRVRSGAICSSACTLIWLAGTYRHLDPKTRLGFHSAREKRETPARFEEGNSQAKAWGLLNDRSAKQQALPTPQTHQATAKAEEPPIAAGPKITDRIEPGTQQAPTTPAPAPGEQPAVTAAQKVVLYEEDPGDPNGKRFVGSAIWRTAMVTVVPGQPPELVIRADIEVPERKLAATWSLRRNTNKGLPATQTVEIMFKLPADFPSGGISNVPGILMKQGEGTRGVPLAGLAAKVTPGFYLIGLSNVEADKERNLQLLKDRAWIDIAVVYNNNRRAILALEKGLPGERMFADAFKAWNTHPELLQTEDRTKPQQPPPDTKAVPWPDPTTVTLPPSTLAKPR